MNTNTALAVQEWDSAKQILASKVAVNNAAADLHQQAEDRHKAAFAEVVAATDTVKASRQKVEACLDAEDGLGLALTVQTISEPAALPATSPTETSSSSASTGGTSETSTPPGDEPAPASPPPVVSDAAIVSLTETAAQPTTTP